MLGGAALPDSVRWCDPARGDLGREGAVLRGAAPVVPLLLVVPASTSGGLGIADDAAVVAVVKDAVEAGMEGAELAGALVPLADPTADVAGAKDAATTAAAVSSLWARLGKTALGFVETGESGMAGDVSKRAMLGAERGERDGSAGGAGTDSVGWLMAICAGGGECGGGDLGDGMSWRWGLVWVGC